MAANKVTVREYNAETGEVIDRDMTAEELTEYKNLQAAREAELLAITA